MFKITEKKIPKWLKIIIILIIVLVILFLVLKYSGLFNKISEGYINEGNELLEQGDYSAAMEQYAYATSLRYLDSESAYDAYLKRGAILFGKHNYEEAISEVSKAVSLKKNRSEGYLLLGKIELANGQVAEALSNLEKALELDGNNPEVMLALGRAVFSQGEQFDPAYQQAGRAESLFRQALEIDQNYAAANFYLVLLLIDKDFAEAQKIIESEIDVRGAFSKKFARVEELILSLAKEKNKNSNAESGAYNRLRIGWVYTGIGENILAKNLAGRVLAELPKYRDAWLLKAWTEIGLGDFSAANDSLTEAYEIDPTFGQTQYLFAKAEIGLGKKNAALGSFKKALDLGYDNQNLRRDYARLLADLEKYSESEKQYYQAYDQDPLNIDTVAELVWFLGEKQGKGEDALAVAENLQTKLAGSQVIAVLALANLVSGNNQVAQDLATKVIAEDPNNLLAYYVRGRAANDQADLIKALDLDFDGVIAGWVIEEIK